MKLNLPVILLKGTVLLPSGELRLEISDELSKSIIEESEIFHSNKLLVVSRLNNCDSYKVDELPIISVVSKIERKILLPDGKLRVVIKGIKRARVLKYLNPNKDNLESIIELIEDIKIDENESKGMIKKLYNEVNEFIEIIPTVSNSMINELQSIDNLSMMTDIISNNINLTKERLFEYLEEVNSVNRLHMLLSDMYKIKEVFELENNIDDKVKKSLDKEEKEYLLREKVKQIKQELGDLSLKEQIIKELKEKVDKLNANENIKLSILKEIRRYEYSSDTSLEVMSIKNYIDWMISLPWNNKTPEYNNLSVIKKRLNKSHYGLDEVKTRIIEYLAVKKNTNNLNSPIICLVGPPGVGKTTLAYRIAKAINRKFVKISVGGVNDEATIKGHQRTYISSQPGKIVDGLRRVNTSNPVFLIDEIDKMTVNTKGDPESALLEVLDPTQNKYFKDNYINEEIDLSDVIFITTANDISNLSSALKDRLEIINLTGYTELEKLDITKNYLIPNIIENHGLNKLNISDEKILEIIRYYTKESGLRELERMLSKIVRKVVLDKTLNNKKNNNIEDLNYYLGSKIYNTLKIENEVGVSNALACTNYGGDVLQVETTYYEGNGNLIITGNVSDTIKESAKIALSYIKSNYELFKIDKKLFKSDIHINIPNIQIKKDGPSAGISITLSIISALTNKSLPTNIAYTGEITLRGNILGVGGIKEKAIGAYLNNIDKVFIPFSNKEQLNNIPNEIKERIKFIPINKFDEVYKYLNK